MSKSEQSRVRTASRKTIGTPASEWSTRGLIHRVNASLRPFTVYASVKRNNTLKGILIKDAHQDCKHGPNKTRPNITQSVLLLLCAYRRIIFFFSYSFAVPMIVSNFNSILLAVKCAPRIRRETFSLRRRTKHYYFLNTGFRTLVRTRIYIIRIVVI